MNESNYILDRMVCRKVIQDPLLFWTKGSIYQYSLLPACWNFDAGKVPRKHVGDWFYGAQFSKIDLPESAGSGKYQNNYFSARYFVDLDELPWHPRKETILDTEIVYNAKVSPRKEASAHFSTWTRACGTYHLVPVVASTRMSNNHNRPPHPQMYIALI